MVESPELAAVAPPSAVSDLLACLEEGAGVSSASSFGLDLLLGRLLAVGSASEGERDRLRDCSSGILYGGTKRVEWVKKDESG